MKNYLYIWHDVKEKSIVASGIQFKDFFPLWNRVGGIVLIEHNFDDAQNDSESKFDFLPSSEIEILSSQNIYLWGNFIWADFDTDAAPLPKISEENIAQILYFSHKAKPLYKTRIPSLNNKFLCHIHDDGWYLRLFYEEWADADKLVCEMLQRNFAEASVPNLKGGTSGYWIRQGVVLEEIMTHEVDIVLNKHLHPH